MTQPLRLAAAAGLLLLAAGCAQMEQPSPSDLAGPFTPRDAFVQNAALGRGLNVMANEPGWQDPAKARFKPQYFRMIHDAGFSTVRIVMSSFASMDSTNTLNPAWLAYLDNTVTAALAAGLNVDLDEHDFMECGDDPDLCRTKLNAFWSQIAPRYKNASHRVLFEILNEPHGKLTPALWNALLKETLAIIRATNPSRNVIVGPANWNGIEDLPKLELSDDPHLIVTFHYYHPFHFTHQGATWTSPEVRTMHDIHWGTPEDYKAIDAEFDAVKAWAEAHHRPIFLGEFGAFQVAPLPDRYLWTAAVARSAEAHGFSWAHWEFRGGFAVYDTDKQRWIEPALRALVPEHMP